MSKKVKTPVTRSFSDAFCLAIKTVLDAKCKDGDAVPALVVAKVLRKEYNFGISSLNLLKVAVNLAVKEGSVEGIAPIRGKNGGLVNIVQRNEWNAKVEAEDATALAAELA